jgi:hypothetical protein
LDGSTARHRSVPRRFDQIAILFALLGPILPGVAYAHAGNPSFRSNLESLSPATPGLKAEVLNYDDRLLLTNRSGRTVLVRGYDGEPYIRIRGDGSVDVNKRSPSYYLNEDRFAKVDVPAQASANAPPDWSAVSKDGRYEWHDHRIHYMSKGVPAQVKDKGKRTKIFNWRVPIEVGGQRGRLAGQLFWQPSSGGIPAGAVIAFAALLFAAVAFVEIVRRRRRGDQQPASRRHKEAWS